jgi:hypothetical protein
MQKAKISFAILLGLFCSWSNQAWAGFVEVQPADWRFYEEFLVDVQPFGEDFEGLGFGDFVFPYPAGETWTYAPQVVPGVSTVTTSRIDIITDDSAPNLFSYTALYTGTALAHVSGDYPHGRALAGVGLNLFALDFELYEKTLVSFTTNVPSALDPYYLQPGTQHLGPGSYRLKYDCLFCTDADASVVGPGIDFQSTASFFNLSFARVPEPNAIALLGIGLIGMALWRRRK